MNKKLLLTLLLMLGIVMLFGADSVEQGVMDYIAEKARAWGLILGFIGIIVGAGFLIFGKTEMGIKVVIGAIVGAGLLMGGSGIVSNMQSKIKSSSTTINSSTGD